MTVSPTDVNGDFSTREFSMSDADFHRIRKIAYSLTGISLGEHKKNMVYGRLARRLRQLKLTRFSDYCELLEGRQSQETAEFVNAITTNLTSFFRENHHFEFLKNTLIPELILKHSADHRIRIWSAGCSTGEEPYSIAMVLKTFPQISNWNVKILATDLDSNVVAKAKYGVYALERAEGIPEQYKRFLDIDEAHQKASAKTQLRELITFKQLNLLSSWPMKGSFDVIFCRNVVIYFDMDTQRRLFDRYANILNNRGKLFIGHSESLHNVSDRFSPLGRTIYERRD